MGRAKTVSTFLLYFETSISTALKCLAWIRAIATNYLFSFCQDLLSILALALLAFAKSELAIAHKYTWPVYSHYLGVSAFLHVVARRN